MTSTFDRLRAIVMKDYKLAADQLTRDAPLDALGIDSLGVADLLFNVEDEFHISLPPEPVQLVTLGDVADFIDGLITAQRQRRTADTALPGSQTAGVATVSAASAAPAPSL